MSRFFSRRSRRSFLAIATALVFTAATSGLPTLAAKPQPPTTLLPLVINNITLNDAGQLVAQGTLGGHAFETPLTLSTSPNAADPTCPVLHLTLAPIHLDLLGLVVDTSAICLDIVAHEGGGLLGDLLCGVAGLLDGGLDLGTILGGLNLSDLGTLLNGITDLLNSVLGSLGSPASLVGVGSSTAATHCDVLNLSLGPVDLNLLGLEVALDNCANGPVTLDITAVPGAGNLLGNLLCNLSNLLNGNANSTAIAAALNRVADAIQNLIG
jgi:hypothetical protein